MKKIFHIFITVLLFTCAFCACKKDLGNYDYKENNIISISTDLANADPQVVINNDSIVVKQNDSLHVNILLSQTKPSTNLSFQWTIVQTAAIIANPGQYELGNAQ